MHELLVLKAVTTMSETRSSATTSFEVVRRLGLPEWLRGALWSYVTKHAKKGNLAKIDSDLLGWLGGTHVFQLCHRTMAPDFKSDAGVLVSRDLDGTLFGRGGARLGECEIATKKQHYLLRNTNYSTFRLFRSFS